MSKEEYKIIHTEEIDLNIYAVRSKKGKWLRSKGYNGGGESWVDDFTQAKIYSKPGPAKAQITFWGTHYPEFGVPDLVRITVGTCQYLDQEERVKIAKEKKIIRELKDDILRTEREIENKKKRTESNVIELKESEKKLNKLKEELNNK